MTQVTIYRFLLSDPVLDVLRIRWYNWETDYRISLFYRGVSKALERPNSLFRWCCVCELLSHGWLSVTPQTSPPGSSVLGFPRQEYGSGWPFLSPGKLTEGNLANKRKTMDSNPGPFILKLAFLLCFSNMGWCLLETASQLYSLMKL